MSEIEKKDEAELALERNENLQRALARKRLMSIGLTVIFAGIAALALAVDLGMTAFCFIVVSLIFLLRYFDAHGHLHEVRRRSTKSLVMDFSVLKGTQRTGEPKQSQAIDGG